MSYLYPKTSRAPLFRILLLLAFGVAAGLAAAFFFFAPRVTSFAPAENAAAGSFAAVEIRFSVPMEPGCTAERFSVDPAVEGELVVEGDSLRFTPSDPWPAGTTVRAAIDSGACSARGLPLLAGRSWVFSPSLVRVAYLPVDQSAGGLLMGIPPGGGDPSVLAAASSPFQDFDVSRRGDFAVLSTGLYNRPGKLWLSFLDGAPARLLLDCGADSCRDPAVSPDGAHVAYVRERLEADPDDPSLSLDPFVEMIPVSGGGPRAVSPAGHAAAGPIWSAQGWLSYYDGTLQAVVVDDLAGGRTSVPNSTGGAWSFLPDGSSVVFPEVFVDEEGETEGSASRVYSFLFRVEIKTNRRVNLSGEGLFEDTSPAVSPDGTRLAFARNFFDSRWTPGRQLWIMNLADASLVQLTRAPDYSHSSIRWSPDGTRLVYMMFHETVPSDPPEIWCINADGSDPRLLVAGGFLPKWIP